MKIFVWIFFWWKFSESDFLVIFRLRKFIDQTNFIEAFLFSVLYRVNIQSNLKKIKCKFGSQATDINYIIVEILVKH